MAALILDKWLCSVRTETETSHCSVAPARHQEFGGAACLRFEYNRFDVFDLKINRKRLTPVSFSGKACPIRRQYYCPGPTLSNPSSYESHFDVCTWPLVGRAEFLTLPLYDLFYF